MGRFDVTRGNITFSIPNEIEIEGETVYIDELNVQDQREDYEGNLCAVELRFETELTGKIAFYIKTSYDELIVSYGTLAEEESMEGFEYEHPEDRPYDLLPGDEISEDFKDNIRIIETDRLKDEQDF